MLEFKVYYDNGDCCGTSKVYAIDTNRDRFLVITPSGHFLWVRTEDCQLEEEEKC